MSGRSEAELSEAIQECAQECVGKSNPRVCVHEFCARLVNARQWSEADAEAVEDAALHVVERLISLQF